MGEMRRLYYQTKDYYSFKRFMWRWDKTVSSNAFQMGRIQIGNVDLPYTYVTSARGSGTGSSYGENADKLLIAESTGSYDKWIIFNLTSGSDSTWGYVIFELPTQVEAKTYRLRTTNDSGAGNYPRRMRLYGTNDETSDPDSASWTLISDVESFTFPTGHFEWSNEIPITPRETNNYYLLAPSDISRGSGLRIQTPDYTVLYSREEQFTRGTYPGGTIPWSEHNVILFKFNGWITGSDTRMSLAVNPPNDTWRVGIRRHDSKFGSAKFAVEKGGWFNNATIDDSSVVASSAWGSGIIFYTIPATTSSNTNEFRIIVDRVNNTVYFYLNGVRRFHQTGFIDYQSTMYLFPDSNTYMKDAYIVGCNSVQDAVSYGQWNY